MNFSGLQGTINKRPEESILGIGYSLLISGEETNGKYDLMLFEASPGVGPPPHVHTREDELFFILDGEFEVLRGDETLQVKSGDYVSLPRNIVHAFRSTGETTGRFLCLVTPGNLKGFFDAFKRPWPDDEQVPSPPNDEDIGKMLTAAENYGIEMKM